MFAKRFKQLHIRGKRGSPNDEENLQASDKTSLTQPKSDIESLTQLNSNEQFSESNHDNEWKRVSLTAESSEHSDDSDTLEQRLKFAKNSASKLTIGLRNTKLKHKLRKTTTSENDKIFSYSGERSLNLDNDSRATAQYSIDTELGQDHRSILERNEDIGQKILNGELEEGVYRGIGAYKPILKRREGAVAAGKYTGAYGPVRGSENIRMTMRIDLNPEICKDYKETGYCGFGDTCKFIHDRSDYKAGWQLEKEWEEQQKKRQERLKKLSEGKADNLNSSESDSSNDDDEESIPFACLICKKKWEINMNPVVTTCGHYFCENCAFKHYSKTSKCAACKRQTSGIFNNADHIIFKTQSKQNAAHGNSP